MSYDPAADARTKLLEDGLPDAPLPPPGEMPAGAGKAAVPHYQTFSGLTNYATRTFRHTFDEALRASPQAARAMRRDVVLMDALRSRQIPTAQLSWHLEPQDESDPRQADAVKLLTDAIRATPRLQQMLMHLLEAVWYGRYGVQLTYEWDYSSGRRVMRVRDHAPINGDKLAFRWSGDVGVLVHAAYNPADHGGTGKVEVTDRGMAYFFSPQEREQIIVHRFEAEDADFYEPEMAGGVHGVGVRGRLYWYWYLAQNHMALLTDYLERLALGFTVAYFDQGNPESARVVQEYMERQIGKNTVLFPRSADRTSNPYGLERLEVGTASAALLEGVARYYHDVMRRYVLGQTLTSETAATGLGSGVAEAHESTFARVIAYDANALQETLTHDFVRVLARYNCPGVPPPRFVFETDADNAPEVFGYARQLYEMGAEVNLDELFEVAGLSRPQPGDAILSRLGELQPSALGEAPQGVPLEGTPGPEQPPGQQQPEQAGDAPAVAVAPPLDPFVTLCNTCLVARTPPDTGSRDRPLAVPRAVRQGRRPVRPGRRAGTRRPGAEGPGGRRPPAGQGPVAEPGHAVRRPPRGGPRRRGRPVGRPEAARRRPRRGGEAGAVEHGRGVEPVPRGGRPRGRVGRRRSRRLPRPRCVHERRVEVRRLPGRGLRGAAGAGPPAPPAARLR